MIPLQLALVVGVVGTVTETLRTGTETGTETLTGTATGTGTGTETITGTETGTRTMSETLTGTVTDTVTETETNTVTPTPIITPTQSLSNTITTTGTMTETMSESLTETQTATKEVTPTATQLVRGELNVPEYLDSVFFNPDLVDALALNFTVSITPPFQDFTGVELLPSASLATFSPTSVVFTPTGPGEMQFLMYGHLIGEDSIRWTVTPHDEDHPEDIQKFKVVGSTSIDIKPRIHFADLIDSRGEWVSYEYSKGEYPGVPSAPLTIELETRPESGVEATFVTNGTGVVFTPELLSFDQMNLVREVQIECTVPGAYQVETVLGGSDPPLMYANKPSWVHNCLEPIETALEYAGSLPQFEENESEMYLITPQARHRDYSGYDLRFTCESHPAGMVFDPEIIVISSQSGAGFTTTAPLGTYSVTCKTHSYTEDPDATPRGVHNNGFTNPSPLIDVEVIERDIVSSPKFPTLRMVTEVSDAIYGGAFSPVVEITLATPPRVGLTVTPVADSVEFVPNMIEFSPGESVKQFRARGTQIESGIPLSYVLSGPSASNYEMSPDGDASLDVTERSTECQTVVGSEECIDLWDSGCWWDGGACRNDLAELVFTPGNPPAQYHNEVKPVIVKLTTPPVRGVTLQLSGTGLTYSETEVYFPPGEDTGSYTVSGVMTDEGETARLHMIYDLVGPDFHKYNRPELKQLVVLPPLQITPPTTQEYPFMYVETESAAFYAILEVPPVNGLTLRATSSPPGMVFEPETLVFGAGVGSAGFTVTTGGETGGYNVTWVVGGTDVAKYAPPQWTVIKVFTRILIHSTPLPTLADEEWSSVQHLQMETAPINPIDVTIYGVSAANPDHTFPPSIIQLSPWEAEPTVPTSSITLTFTPTHRTLQYKVRGMTPGWYAVKYSLAPHRENFTDPAMRDFNVAAPAVWDYTRGQNGVEPKCRVAVGRIGYASKAVQDVSQETCKISDIMDESTLCNVPSKTECDYELRTNSRPCVWTDNTCSFGLPTGNVTHYSIGETHSIFRLLDGGLWSAGSNTFGQLGHSCYGVAGCKDSVLYKEVLFEDLDETGLCKSRGSDGACDMIPASELTNYGVLDYVTGVVTGSSHSMALTVSGRLYTWGANNHGQLGVVTDRQMVTSPKRVGIPERPLIETITCISGGAYHSVAISDRGIVYVWGWNYFGQLGELSTYRGSIKTPVKITEVVPSWITDPPVSISAGDYHTVIGTASGEIYTFGRNNYGQLARVTEFNDPVPTKVDVAAPPAVFHGGAATRAWGCKDEDRVNYESWPVGTDFTLGRGELSVYERQQA